MKVFHWSWQKKRRRHVKDDHNNGAGHVALDEIKAAGGEAVANYDSVSTPDGGKKITQCALDRRRQ